MQASPVELMVTLNNMNACSSQVPSPLSSAFPRPIPSYQPSPSSCALPGLTRNDINASLHSFLFLCNSTPSNLAPLQLSNTAPVTPLMLSPTSRAPKQTFNFEAIAKESLASFSFHIFAEFAPLSPVHCRNITEPTTIKCNELDCSTMDSCQWISFKIFTRPPIPTSPTFSLVKQMVHQMTLDDVMVNRSSVAKPESVKIKHWEGERIHDVGLDDLELTLGSRKART